MPAIWELVSETEQRANFIVARDILTCPSPAGSEAATIGRALLVLTDARSAAVFFRARNGDVVCPWSHNLSDAYVGQLITPGGVNPWTHLVRTPELTCIDMQKRSQTYKTKAWFLRDVRELPRHNTVRRRIEREGLRSVCTWPLSSAGQVIGAIAYYYDAPHVHVASEEEAMRAFVLEAAAIVPNRIATRTRREEPLEFEAGATEFAEARAAVEIATFNGAQLQQALDSNAARFSGFRQSLEAERHQTHEMHHATAAESPRFAGDRGELNIEQAGLSLDYIALRGEHDRLATLRHELAVKQTQLAAERVSVDGEYRRLADVRTALDAENERLLDMRRRLDADAARITAERQEMEVEHSRCESVQVRLDPEEAALRRA